MDQYLEPQFATLSLPYEVPSTSLEQEVQIDDVIETIGRLNREENEAPLIKQPGPSRKIPKRVTNTLQSVHSKVRKMGTKIFTKQEDVGVLEEIEVWNSLYNYLSLL